MIMKNLNYHSRVNGYGYMSDFDAERYYRDARVLRIYEGTTKINDLIII